MTTRDELLQHLIDTAYIEGDITLSSGRQSSWYADLRLLTMDRVSSLTIGRLLTDITHDLAYDSVGGLTMGADPVAAAILHADNSTVTKSFSVRKQPKSHGTGKLIEGPSIERVRVLIVEDVSTTGESALRAVRAAHDAGAIVTGAAAIVDRGGSQAIEKEGIPFRALFTETDIAQFRITNSRQRH